MRGCYLFGHAASFGGGAYTVAPLLTHVAPKILKSYQILIGDVNITEIVILIVCFWRYIGFYPDWFAV